MIKVLVVDDSVFMREIIKDIVSKQEDMQIVGEAEDGVGAFEKYKQLKPDIVTLDIVMGESNGIDGLGKILEYDRNALVVMITSIGQEKYVKQCLDMGAKGFIIKPFAESDVLDTIRKVISYGL